MMSPYKTVADIEREIATRSRLPQNLLKPIQGLGKLEIYVAPYGRHDTDDVKARNWSVHARRIETCGGSWEPVRGYSSERHVSLPLPLTNLAREALIQLVDEYTRPYSPDKAVITTNRGDHVTRQIGRLNARRGLTDEERIARVSEWSRIADYADGYVRGAWQRDAEHVYDAAQREERVRLRKLAWQRKELLAQLADVDQKISAERDRISHLPTGIRRAIEAEADREPMHPMWSTT